MATLYLDIALCLTTYAILIGFIFWRKSRKNRPDDSSGDGEGGLPIETGPKLDLPPGVCLPGDGPRIRKKDQLDEVLI